MSITKYLIVACCIFFAFLLMNKAGYQQATKDMQDTIKEICTGKEDTCLELLKKIEANNE